MPIIKAAIKHQRQSAKHRRVNRAMKDKLKDTMKEMLKLAANKKTEELKQRFPGAMAIIDKAAKNNLLHSNNAARKKSRIAHLLAAK